MDTKELYFLIFGSGSLADALAKECNTLGIKYHFYKYQGMPQLGAQPETLALYARTMNAVIAHVGSGDSFDIAADWAKEHDVPLIQCTTNLNEPIKDFFKDGRGAVVIEAPIANLPLLRLVKLAEQFKEIIQEDMYLHLTKAGVGLRKDSHSIGDELVKHLRIPNDQVSTIRDPELMLDYGLDPSDSEFFSLVARGQGLKIKLSAQTLGLEAYALGIIDIAELVWENKREIGHGVHQLDQIVHSYKTP